MVVAAALVRPPGAGGSPDASDAVVSEDGQALKRSLTST